jgi:hypothetical protein
MKDVGTDTRVLYAMFELAVYAGCDKIVFFIENIKPQIGKLVTSLAVAVNDRSHPVSAYLLGEAGSNSEADGPKPRDRSPIRNARGMSFRKVSMHVRTRGRPRVDRVLACELSHQKHLLFIENVLTLLQKGTYRTAGVNVDLYNFFANIGALTWSTRFNQLERVRFEFFVFGLYPIFAKFDEDELALNKTLRLCEGVLGKKSEDKLTKDEYNALRYTVGPDSQTMVEGHYLPFTKEEFEGAFSTTDFAKDLKLIGKKLKIDLIAFFYPVEAEVVVEEAFEKASGELDLGAA